MIGVLGTIFSTTLFLFFSCKTNTENKEQTQDLPYPQVFATNEAIKRKINFDKYDSVIFYKNVSWINLKGESKLNEKEKYYPFTAYCYKDQIIELKIFLTKNKTLTRHIKRYKGYRYIQTKYFSRENRDTVYKVTLLLNDTISIDFHGIGNRLIYHGKSKEDIYFNSVGINIMPKKNILHTLSYSQMFTEKKYSQDTLIKNIEIGNTLINDYESFYEEIVELKKGNIYHIYDQSHDKSIGSKSENNEEYLQTENILSNSFFYFLSNIREFETTVF